MLEPSKSLRENLVYILLILIGGIYVTQLRLIFASEYEPASLIKLMAGTAATPFQFRFLSPLALRLLHEATSADLTTLVRWYEFVIFILSTIAIQQYAKETNIPKPIANITSLGLIFIYPFLYIYQPLSRLYYPYDSASILFWSAGLWSIAKLKPATFLCILSLGLLNRESIILLFPLGIIIFREKLTPNQLLAIILLGLMSILTAKLTTLYLYGNNPGSGFLSFDHDILHKGLPKSLHTSRIYTNIMQFSSIESISCVAASIGFLWIPTLAFHRTIKNKVVKSSTYLIPTSFLIMMFVGNIDEGRVFCELSPVVLVALSHIIHQKISTPTNVA